MKQVAIAIAVAVLAALLAWAAWNDSDIAPELFDGMLDGVATGQSDVAHIDTADIEPNNEDADLLRQLVASQSDAQGIETTELLLRVRHEDGKPVANVTVIVAPPLVADARLDEASAVTSEAGEAAFSLLPGRYECRTSLGASASVTLLAGHGQIVVLVLPYLPAVCGIVVDDHDQPIAGAEVLVLGLSAVGTARVSARTTTDGHFELRGIGAGRQIAARHAEFAPSAPQRVELADATAATVTIRLLPHHGRVSGTVATQQGVPVPGAVVWFGPGTVGNFPAQTTRTDGNGYYRSPALPEGPIEVRAVAPGHALESTRTTVQRDGEAVVHLRLHGGGVVRGVARLQDGSPATQCLVWNGVRRAIGGRLARTGVDGSFFLDRLPVGEVELTALGLASDGISLQRATARVTVAIDVATEWNPTLGPARRGAVHGTARLDDGTPLLGWLVLATPRGQSRGLGVETREGGAFTLLGLPAGEVSLSLRRPDAGWQSFVDADLEGVAVDGDAVEFVVPAEALDRATLLGSVRDETGRACAATLRMTHASGAFAQYATRLDGTFRVDGIPQGEVRMEVRCEKMPVYLQPPMSLRGRETRDLGTLVVRLGGAAFGRLLGVDDEPPTNASVRLIGSGNRDLGEVEVDAVGYRTPTVEAGRYELLVQAESVAPARVPLEIPRGGLTELDIRMLPGSLHRILVKTQDVRDFTSRVSIVIFDQAGKAVWTSNLPMTQGEAEFRAWLSDGEFQVLALGMRQQRVRDSFAVEAGSASGPGRTLLELGR